MNAILVPEPITLVCRIPIVDDPTDQLKPAKRVRRGRSMQTHCKSGHELVEPNLYYPKSGKRKRECRACVRNRALKYQAKVAQRDHDQNNR